MTDDDQVNEIVAMIRETWGDQDDFEEGGWNYAAFVIREDLLEMERKRWRDQDCLREMTDVVINAARAIDELPPSAFRLDDCVRHRLQGHENKGIDSIVGDYQRRFEKRL